MLVMSPVLWLASCAPVQTPSPADADASVVVVEPSTWSRTTAPRFAAVNHEITAVGSEFVAHFPSMAMTATFSTGGLQLGGEGLHLGLAGWGRLGDERPVATVSPALGLAIAGVSDPAGRPLRRLEYAHDAITEWWAGVPEGLEHGFTLESPPPGEALLAFSLDLDGLEVLSVEPDTVTLLGSDDRIYDYAGLLAFDAEGDPLPAWFDNTDGVLAVHVDDRGATYPLEVDPVLTTAATTLSGPSSGSDFGIVTHSAGDVDADGYDDLLVGAPRASTLTGRAYVFHGSASGLSTTATTTLSVSGVKLCGNRVAGGGDANADGYDDVAISCTFDGDVFVFHGSASGVSTTATTELDGGSGQRFGLSLALDGDATGDGYADLVVGSPAQSSAKGRIYLYEGGASGISTSSDTFDGDTNSAYLGEALAYAGDVNDDGFDDIIVGAPYHSSSALLTYEGRVQVHHGSASGFDSSPDTEIDGGTAAGYFGWSVAGGGDVDGDGYDDVVVGQDSLTGSAWVFHGSASGVSSTASTTLSETGTDYGLAVCIVGDTDGDGYDDVAVGAPTSQDVYVYDGSASGVSTTASTTLSGSGSDFGISLAGLDSNGDGYADLAVGDDDDSSGYGAVYVYLGYAEADTGTDDDGDGYDAGSGAGEDCDDTDASVNPGASEVVGDGIDQDCDGVETCYDDDDQDGYLDTAGDTVASTDTDCDDAGEGSADTPTTDCDDADAAYNPGAAEGDCTDPNDYNCDGSTGFDDGDGDGYAACEDCDDNDASVNPGATDSVGDGIDQDCDGTETCYRDADGDGARGTATISSTDTDCDDAGEALGTADVDCATGDATIYPGATEVVGDGTDQDCDGGETCYADADGDGYRGDDTVASTDEDCTDPGEALSTADGGDCDDDDDTVNPGATDTHGDGTDQDCDGTETCYADADADGYRTASTVASTDGDCDDAGEALSSAPADDCDDDDDSVYPGATEGTGDGIDGDCDGTETCLVDADDDGYTTTGTVASADTDCDDPGEGTSSEPGDDCDDGDASIFPGATETVADGIDQDCDGAEGCYADADGDGYRTGTTIASDDTDCDDPGEAAESVTAGDCDDDDATVNPAATETAGDEVDQDCDGSEECYVDADGDGWRTSGTVGSTDAACDGAGEATEGTPSTDCDDADASVNPGATETTGDGIDQDCDGTEVCFLDEDDDGFLADSPGTLASADTDCDDSLEGSTGDPSGDCDDADAAYNPAATEGDCTDPADYNCDGSVGYNDDDGDGYAACEECDDADASVYPGAPEVVGDGIDADCDGTETCYVDTDGDGYRPDDTTTVASADTDCLDAGEAESTAPGDDCDDADAGVNPGATEVVGDEVDQDCDGREACFADGDLDGYRSDTDTVESSDDDCGDIAEAALGDDAGDCNDNSSAHHPGAEEPCDELEDYNCDGAVGSEDGDLDGYVACDDCDDGASAVNPAATEVCDGIDNDCDGYRDEEAADGFRVYADSDDDGYGNPSVGYLVCESLDGFVPNGDDCDDSSDAVNPAATEVPGDGIDQDCDGYDGDPADTGDTATPDDTDTAPDTDTDTGEPGPPPDSGTPRAGGLYGGLSCSSGTVPPSAAAGLLAALLLRRRRAPPA